MKVLYPVARYGLSLLQTRFNYLNFGSSQDTKTYLQWENLVSKLRNVSTLTNFGSLASLKIDGQ